MHGGTILFRAASFEGIAAPNIASEKTHKAIITTIPLANAILLRIISNIAQILEVDTLFTAKKCVYKRKQY